MAIGGWIEDRAIENRVYDPRTGKHKASLWDSAIGGLFGADVHGAVSDAGKTEQRQIGQKLLTEYGLTPADVGLSSDNLTESSAMSAIRRHTKKEDAATRKTEFERQMAPLLMSDRRQTKAMEASNQLANAQLTQSTQLANAQLRQSGNQFKMEQARLAAQMEKENNLAVLTMQQNSADRLAELEYRKMADRRADQQYNERIERADKKDRQAAAQNMAMGLISLASAFAV